MSFSDRTKFLIINEKVSNYCPISEIEAYLDEKIITKGFFNFAARYPYFLEYLIKRFFEIFEKNIPDLLLYSNYYTDNIWLQQVVDKKIILELNILILNKYKYNINLLKKIKFKQQEEATRYIDKLEQEYCYEENIINLILNETNDDNFNYIFNDIKKLLKPYLKITIPPHVTHILDSNLLVILKLFFDNNVDFTIDNTLLIKNNKLECVKYLIFKGRSFYNPKGVINDTAKYINSMIQNLDIDLLVRLGYGTMEHNIPTLDDLSILVNNLIDDKKQIYLNKLILELPTLFILIIDKLNIKKYDHYLDKAVENKILNIVKYLVKKGITKKVDSFSLNNKCINYLKLKNDVFSDYFVFVLENLKNKDLVINKEYLNHKQIKFIEDQK